MTRDEATRAASRNPALNVEIDFISKPKQKIQILQFRINKLKKELSELEGLLSRLLEKEE